VAELNDKITDERFEQLIVRLRQLHAEGTLRYRDMMAMYDLMIEACQRDEAETLERYLTESLKGDVEGGDAE
jgi:hypothetical protein